MASGELDRNEHGEPIKRPTFPRGEPPVAVDHDESSSPISQPDPDLVQLAEGLAEAHQTVVDAAMVLRRARNRAAEANTVWQAACRARTLGAGVTPIGPAPPCTCDCRERLEKLIVSIEALRDDARIVMEIWKTNTKRTRKVHFRAMGQEHTCQLLLKEAKP